MDENDVRRQIEEALKRFQVEIGADFDRKLTEFLSDQGISQPDIHFGDAPPVGGLFNKIGSVAKFAVWVFRTSGKVIVWLVQGASWYTAAQLVTEVFAPGTLPDLRFEAERLHYRLFDHKPVPEIRWASDLRRRSLLLDTKWASISTNDLYLQAVSALAQPVPEPEADEQRPKPDLWLITEETGIIRRETLDGGIPLFATAAMYNNSMHVANETAIRMHGQTIQRNMAAQTARNNAFITLNRLHGR